MKKYLIAICAGLLFGAGLAVSEMINPNKVLSFLDVTGQWDPSLLLVMGAGLFVTTIGFRIIFRRDTPFFSDNFFLPSHQAVDKRLLWGAVVFGAGWGLGGYCPGPAIAALSLGFWEPFVFIAAMLLGTSVAKLVSR